MAVGQDIGVGREDDAGAAAVDAVVRSGDLQMQDRRADPVDGADHGARIGVEQSEVLGRRRKSPSPEQPGSTVADGIVNRGEIVM